MFEAPIPADDAARLTALRRYEILDTDREQPYDDIVRLACFICDTPFALVTLVDKTRQWFKAEIGMGIRETPRAPSFCATAMQQPKPTIIPDTLLDPRYADNPFVVGAPGIRFYVGTPLVTSDGYPLGTLCVFDTHPRSIRPKQVAALQALGRQVMAQLELRLRMRENEKQAMALRTTEKLAVVGRLASSMAHEINNPLQSVTNLLYMTGIDQGSESSKAYLVQAQDELRRVTHIVTQTLRFHQQSEKAAPARVGEIVESVAALFATRLRHAASLVAIEDHQTQLLRCNASDLRQVFANLLGNALDAVVAARSHTIRFRINDAVEATTRARGIRVTVADDGVGMSRETRQRLFEPFYSTKGARGTGLGLWVSHGILEKHKATVRVKSCEGPARRGTVFRIFFPLENGL